MSLIVMQNVSVKSVDVSESGRAVYFLLSRQTAILDVIVAGGLLPAWISMVYISRILGQGIDMILFAAEN